MGRVIGHLDLDYFYAQVEEVENPSLKQIPVVVCVYSGRTSDSGVVSTANYKAREHGVKSGMPITLAKKRLEGVEASFIKMEHAKYEAYSDRIMDIIRVETDVTEKAGIDEAFFDVTERTGGDYTEAERLAVEIKAKIREDQRLTCSIGLGTNKIIAKIASDLQKPDGLTVIRPEDTLAFLFPLGVEKLYGVGPKTSRILKENGINSIEDLAKTPIDRVERLLDRKLAIYLHNAANGNNDEQVVDGSEPSQLGRIITLKSDTSDPTKVMTELAPALKDVHGKLLARNLFFRTISVMGILTDLSVRSRGKTLETPTNDYFTLEKETEGLLDLLLHETGDIRRAGVRVMDLVNMADQSSLTQFMG